jgi:ubiquinone/menaquinone biosynthesis C-methylase UbiE
MQKSFNASSMTSSKRRFAPQVDDPNYFTMPYLSRERWVSFWYQIMEVTESLTWKDPILPMKGSDPLKRSVLEIGPGSGIVSWVLRRMGISVTTVDIDERLKPYIVGDVTRLPFTDRSFDTIFAAEVLEHIPFEEVPITLQEFSRVATNSLVITLPHFSHFAPSIALKLFPFLPRFSRVFPVSFPVSHRFDGQHYWEIGKRGTSLPVVKRTLVMHTGFEMKKEYLIEENPFHHVFVLTHRE